VLNLLQEVVIVVVEQLVVEVQVQVQPGLEQLRLRVGRPQGLVQ